MDLYIFPQAACLTDGYGVAVENAYRKLSPQKDDIVVWYTNHSRENIMYFRNNDYIISKIPTTSFLSFYNVFRGRVRSELSVSMLKFLKKYKFDHIHCDEVIFYRALKTLFPDTPMTVRFHNCFSRIYFRNVLFQNKLDLKFRITLRCELNIERLIFQDNSIKKVFISDEDRNFYASMFGVNTDSEVWPFVPDMKMAILNRQPIVNPKDIIWFGGMDSHKVASMNWFVNDVFPQIVRAIPNVKLHLFGGGTRTFDNPAKGIYGHGYYKGKESVPMRNALYINPDIIGGGVKIKLLTYFEAGVPFISTNFGFEGYDQSLIDGKYCIVQEKGKWAETIINYFKCNHCD